MRDSRGQERQVGMDILVGEAPSWESLGLADIGT